jgi:hypothetical protein
MTGRPLGPLARTAVVLATAAIGIALLGGCTQKPASTTGSAPVAGGPTALGGLAVARSAVSTTVPDAKLVAVQTAEAVSPTQSPTWAYAFGSPSTDMVWSVYVSNGHIIVPATEEGTAGLTPAEWAQVPGTDVWKIDSDQALTKALAASSATTTPSLYMMGMLTYKPTADSSTVEPFVWSVVYEVDGNGVTVGPVNVDARTGAATLQK